MSDGEPRYFTAPDGITYRVYDATMKAGALVVANPLASWASSRVFRPKTGHRRLYRFAAGESREPSDEQLERQLRVAEYLPTEKHEPRDLDPR